MVQVYEGEAPTGTSMLGMELTAGTRELNRASRRRPVALNSVSMTLMNLSRFHVLRTMSASGVSSSASGRSGAIIIETVTSACRTSAQSPPVELSPLQRDMVIYTEHKNKCVKVFNVSRLHAAWPCS